MVIFMSDLAGFVSAFGKSKFMERVLSLHILTGNYSMTMLVDTFLYIFLEACN